MDIVLEFRDGELRTVKDSPYGHKTTMTYYRLLEAEWRSIVRTLLLCFAVT